MAAKFGIDYAWGTPDISALKANHVEFVCRYLSHDPSKNLTGAEATTLHRAGIAIVTVWESQATRAADGHAAGVEDARAALAQLVACGAPKGAPVFFAVDFDSTANPGQTDAYFDGAASVLGKVRVGSYGGLAVTQRHLNRGFVYAWQTYAWSGGKWDPRARLRQYSNGHTLAGVSCDYDQAIAEDFGQWRYVAPPVKPPTIRTRLVKALRRGGFGPKSAQAIADATQRGGVNINR